MAGNHLSVESRFWLKVQKTESCWLWIGTRNRGGYGVIKENKRPKLAHRISLRIHGVTIPPGLFVLHRCDNPRCVRPDHLFIGTQADNLADMDAKGRRVIYDRHGELNSFAKLTVSQVRFIRTSQKSQRVLAREMGLCKSTIGNIRRRDNWRHVS